MQRLCPNYQLAGRCFRSVALNPGKYVLAGMFAAVGQSLALAQQALLASQENPPELTSTVPWMVLVIACLVASLAACIPQWSLSCAAAQGLDLGGQMTLLKSRHRAILEAWLRMLGVMLRCALKPWLVCVVATVGLMGISYVTTMLWGSRQHGAFWKRIALGPMESATLTIGVLSAVCGLWALARAVSRLTLVWPLVLAGVAPKIAVGQSIARGQLVRGWLIGGCALTYLPIFICQGLALWGESASGAGMVKDAAAYASFMVPILGGLVAGSFPAMAHAELKASAAAETTSMAQAA